MKISNLLRLVLTLALAAFLAAGCAKKPAPSAEEEAVVTEMPSEEILGIEEGAITEGAVVEPGVGVAGEARLEGELAAPSLQRIYFDFDQYTLTSEARETLAVNAAFLTANPSANVTIEGHCDERGSDEYNLALGERRATAAKKYLQSLGVSASRLSIISYGEELPLEPGHNEEAWAKNRRAEFKEVR